jgi:tetratricopeptide (TPR) repeat protein
LTYLAKTKKEKKQAYKDTIEAYRQIVFSPRKRLLNYQDLIESTVFLGYAYAKNEQYQEAEYHMNVVEACLPNYWLIHYIKACLYTLEYEKINKETLLDEALDSLETAVLIDDSNNSSRSEALADPDLRTLRTKRKEQFAKIVKQGAVS